MKVSKALVNGRNICMVGTLAPSDSSWFRVASKVMTNYCTLIQCICSKKHEWKSMWVYSDFVCSTGSSSSSESLAPSYSPLVASWTVLELLRINQTNCRYPTILFFRIFTKMEYQYQWRPYRITRQRKTAHSSYSFFTIANIPSPGYISARFLTPLLIINYDAPHLTDVPWGRRRVAGRTRWPSIARKWFQGNKNPPGHPASAGWSSSPYPPECPNCRGSTHKNNPKKLTKRTTSPYV